MTWRRMRLRLHAPHPVLPRLLHHVLALCGRGVMPLFAQQLASLRWEPLEAAEILPDRRLLIRWQGLKFLPSLTQLPTLVGWKRVPLLEALLCQPTLLR